jgi:hypothetical protein
VGFIFFYCESRGFLGSFVEDDGFFMKWKEGFLVWWWIDDLDWG